jgi:ADP-ribose pyrophosphatase
MSVVYKGKWFTLEQEMVRMPGGKEFLAEWVTRTDGVRILARRGDELLLSDEYREELGARDSRLPGGKVENGCTPVEAAMAELQEETGYRADQWHEIGSTQAFAMVRYRLHYFEARDLSFEPIDHDEGEDIRIQWVGLAEAAEMAVDGRVGEDLSALQILRLANREGFR